jgi:hypothetical protein
MSTKFKVGDRVKCFDSYTGTLTCIDVDNITVKRDDGDTGCGLNGDWQMTDFDDMVKIEPKLEVGDSVEVIDWGCMYSTNQHLVKELGLKHFVNDDNAHFENHSKGVICKIVSLTRDGDIVGIQAKSGQEYVIGQRGLKFLAHEGELYTTMSDNDYELPDVQKFWGESYPRMWGADFGHKSFDMHKMIAELSAYYYKKDNKKTMSNIKLIYRNLTRTEPEKTFVKAGIMDEELNLTEDGEEMFIAYMFEQNKEAFKKDVADKVLAEIESAKKK